MKKKYVLFFINIIVSSAIFADTSFTIINNSSHDIWFNDVGWNVDIGRCSIHPKGASGSLIASHQQFQFSLELHGDNDCRLYKGILGFADKNKTGGLSDYSLVRMESSSSGNINFSYYANPNSNLSASPFTQQSITFVDR